MNLIPSGVIQVSLWFQLLLWMWLYHSEIHFTDLVKPAYYLGGLLALFLVYVNQTTIYYYTTTILMQYVIMIMLATQLYDTRFEFKQAICLAFLTVFLNSFYWEFFYHVYEFQIWLPYSLGFGWWWVRLPQWIRILPAFWVTRNFEILDTRAISIGLVISFILTYARFVWHIQNWVHPVHRIICLCLLIYTIINSKPRMEIDAEK